MPEALTLDTKRKIELSLNSFNNTDLFDACKALLNSLGYNSDKSLRITPNNYAGFAQVIDVTKNNFNKVKACISDWNKIEIIFQLGDDDLSSQSALFDTKRVDNKIIESYLFLAIELKNQSYNRSTLAKITREVNKLTLMPAIILFNYNNLLTISIIDRRLHKRYESQDVLEKVTLIKDIELEKPHRAHIEILFDLSIDELKNNHTVTNFIELHTAWQKTLDTKELNNKFYEKLFNWYLWASKQVKFPQIRSEEDMLQDEVHQSESLIRLLTRLLFVWFMKEKGLINPVLFDRNKLLSILKNIDCINGEETIYYKAILQNLFFATLNKPIERRKVIDKGFNPKEHGDPLVYRYPEYFNDPKNFIKLFENIPFLNGGLFECLDQKKDKDNPVEIRLDGFSTKKGKQPIVPDKLFFGEYKNIDLSKDYDDKKKNKQTVYGLIDILNQYKFTIEENTPVEEEVALDPELLGKVFENLLASYNPETKTTARNQTGSFYTPREIVNYMVDESIIAYLKNHINDDDRLRKLLSYNKSETENPFNQKESFTLLKAIDSCKILDPACGSGAFPMGILQKMIFILHKLDPTNKMWFDMVVENIPAYMRDEFRKRLGKESWNYVRKLGIIQQCIYGVDIQPIATQIAKLRFFISLLVDQDDKPDVPNRGFEPLPNLDFKIMTANTLISAPASDVKSEGLFEAQTDLFFVEFDKLTELYFNTSEEEEKKKLRKQITILINKKCEEKIAQIERSYASEDERIREALKEKKKEFISAKENEIKLWQSYTNLFKHESVGFFEPRYFFPKVNEGFHIIIGNPPYGILNKRQNKAESIVVSDEELDYYKNSEYYAPASGGMINIFRLFILRSIRLLIEDGVFSEIFPLAFLGDISIKKLRKYILDDCQIISIEAFPERDNPNKRVFEAVKMSVCILNLLNTKNETPFFIRINDDRYINKYAEKNILTKSLIKILDIVGFTFPLTSAAQTKLLVKIFKSGKRFNEIGKCNTGEIDMTLFKEAFSYNNRNAILLKGAIIDRYLLRKKMSQGEIIFIDENKLFKLKSLDKDFKNQERIVLQGITGINEKIRLKMMIVKNAYCANSLNYLVTKNEICRRYLLGIFNSKLLNFVFKCFSTNSNVNGYEVDNLPIIINNKFEFSIKTVVNYVLLLKELNKDSDYFENIIEALVYELYFSEEIKSAGCEVLKYLNNLPELKEEWTDDKKLKTVQQVYKELSNPEHPVSVSLFKMDTIEEVRIIEGNE